MTEFRLLGPVEVWAGGRPVDAGQPRQRGVLAALLVDAGRLVTWETLVDRVWGDAPPSQARHTLYSHIARIRSVLARVAVAEPWPARLERAPGGYVLRVDPDRVDLHRFRHLVERARGPDRTDAERLAWLREALSLWRGEPLAGLSGRWAVRVRDGWRQQRLDAVISWARAELHAGNAGVVIGHLNDLLAEHPLTEPLAEVLMRALNAAGRSAEALDRYTTTRQRLIDELGVEPGSDLRDLHRSILRGDLGRPAPAAPGVAAPGLAIPAQLPVDVRGFAVRDAELAQLDAVVAAASGHPTTVVICALVGTAGVGKTALAVHWAHRAAHRFSDGQLYVNLRGFDPARSVATPTEVICGFLDAFAVPAQLIPAGLDAQIGLYRSILAGRRVLVLLDNAHDAEQVRPLLPGTPGCLVIVTSRNRLAGLVAAEGAYPLSLDLFTLAEARQMLAKRLGAARAAAEPQAVDEIIERCARLPLALAVAAARANTRHPLAALAAELRTTPGNLDPFAIGDHSTDLRAVFSSSYRTLTPPTARLFRLISLHPGPDITVPAAASLAGVPAGKARHLIAELANLQMVDERAPGRYRSHDLLRDYAAELAHREDTEPTKRAAQHRMLDHYLHSAYAADLLVYAHRRPIGLAPPQPGVTPEPQTDRAQALRWFTAEHPVLVAAVHLAVHTGLEHHAWQLMSALLHVTHFRHTWSSLAAVLPTLTDAIPRLADRASQAQAYLTLGVIYDRLGRYDDGELAHRYAIGCFAELGDQSDLATAYRRMADSFAQRNRHREALGFAQQALNLYNAAGDRSGEATALNAVGWYHSLLGEHQLALTYCQRALGRHTESGNHLGAAATHDSIGYTYHQLGDHRRAVNQFNRALELYRDVGDHDGEAETLTHLGDTHHATGDHGAARTAWQRAQDILVNLGHPHADKVRTRLWLVNRPPGR